MIEYTIDRMPFHKSWGLFRNDGMGLVPMAFFKSEEKAKMFEREIRMLARPECLR